MSSRSNSRSPSKRVWSSIGVATAVAAGLATTLYYRRRSHVKNVNNASVILVSTTFYKTTTDPRLRLCVNTLTEAKRHGLRIVLVDASGDQVCEGASCSSSVVHQCTVDSFEWRR